jgi:hypothetical protein
MSRRALMAALLLMVSPWVARADDKIVGAVWEIKIPGKSNDKDSTVRYRATNDGKVFDIGSEVIGSWKGDNDNVEMEITGFKDKKALFNGKYVLTNISRKAKVPRWSGKWTPEGGNPRNIVVKLLRD